VVKSKTQDIKRFQKKRRSKQQRRGGKEKKSNMKKRGAKRVLDSRGKTNPLTGKEQQFGNRCRRRKGIQKEGTMD